MGGSGLESLNFFVGIAPPYLTDSALKPQAETFQEVKVTPNELAPPIYGHAMVKPVYSGTVSQEIWSLGNCVVAT